MKRARRGISLDNRDAGLITIHDLPAALGLLTRLPVPVNTDRAMARGAAAAWAYPLVGLVVGVICAASVALLLAAGLPSGIVAALVLAVSVILTGAMHEDGLADSADGLWGGWDRTRRLAIMKDSHIGVYGVIALALTLMIRWLVLLAVVATGSYWPVLIGLGVVSRTGMVVLMATLPNARADGLSQHVGRPAAATAWLAVALGAVIGLICIGVGPILAAVGATLLCGMVARSKIGGQTGDILGATQQITEIAVLLVIVAVMG